MVETFRQARLVGGGYNQANRDRWVARQARRIPTGRRVLDVGAGSGRYRSLFWHCDYRAHDFGQEPGTIGSYTQLDYQSDICAIPVPDASFDVVLCTEVLEHVPEPILALRELSRIIRPGGRLLLTAPLGSILHQEPYHFYGGYTPHWYHRFLAECGFEIDEIDRNEGFFSLFGQEAQRFSALINPRRVETGWATKVALGLVWLVTLPWMRGVFPLIGPLLDRLGLERQATAGYHVTATRRRVDTASRGER